MLEQLRVVFVSILTGIGIGVIFMVCRLPLPAPSTLAGVTGILGIYLGFKLFLWFKW